MAKWFGGGGKHEGSNDAVRAQETAREIADRAHRASSDAHRRLGGNIDWDEHERLTGDGK